MVGGYRTDRVEQRGVRRAVDPFVVAKCDLERERTVALGRQALAHHALGHVRLDERAVERDRRRHRLQREAARRQVARGVAEGARRQRERERLGRLDVVARHAAHRPLEGQCVLVQGEDGEMRPHLRLPMRAQSSCY